MAESARMGVTINSVLPGPTRSEGVGAFAAQMAGQQGISEDEMEGRVFETARPSSLLRRFLTTDEVANTIAASMGALCGRSRERSTGGGRAIVSRSTRLPGRDQLLERAVDRVVHLRVDAVDRSTRPNDGAGDALSFRPRAGLRIEISHRRL